MALPQSGNPGSGPRVPGPTHPDLRLPLSLAGNRLPQFEDFAVPFDELALQASDILE